MLAYLGHMLGAAEAPVSSVGPRSLDALAAEPMRVDATVRQTEILGEAASRVGADVRASHPDIPWRQAVAARNVSVHDYASLLPEVVWTTVQEDLPALIRMLKSLLGR